jgi:hypothetical protein
VTWISGKSCTFCLLRISTEVYRSSRSIIRTVVFYTFGLSLFRGQLFSQLGHYMRWLLWWTFYFFSCWRLLFAIWTICKDMQYDYNMWTISAFCTLCCWWWLIFIVQISHEILLNFSMSEKCLLWRLLLTWFLLSILRNFACELFPTNFRSVYVLVTIVLYYYLAFLICRKYTCINFLYFKFSKKYYGLGFGWKFSIMNVILLCYLYNAVLFDVYWFCSKCLTISLEF